MSELEVKLAALVVQWRRQSRIYEEQALGHLVGSVEERINSSKAGTLEHCAIQLEAALQQQGGR